MALTRRRAVLVAVVAVALLTLVSGAVIGDVLVFGRAADGSPTAFAASTTATPTTTAPSSLAPEMDAASVDATDASTARAERIRSADRAHNADGDGSGAKAHPSADNAVRRQGGANAATQPATTTSPTATPDPYAFEFEVVRTASCGTTCRDVTVSLTNTGTATATDVRVTTRLEAGDATLWQGSEDVGSVAPGDSVIRTRRVTIGLVDAARIQQNDGYVTIRTTVDWSDGTTTFTVRERVV